MRDACKTGLVALVVSISLPGCGRSVLPLLDGSSGRLPVLLQEQAPPTLAEPPAPSPGGESEENNEVEPPAGPPAEPARNVLLQGPGHTQLRVSSPFQERGAAPMTVLLHGICNNPRVTCGWFHEEDLGPTWQVCPAGNVPCGGDGYQWSVHSPERLERHVLGGVAHTQERYGARISPEDAVLVGFSLGAVAAVTLLASGTQRFSGVVLVGASVSPSAEQLALAGVRRIALAAGDHDGAAPAMRRAAASLRKRGVQARFESLGRVGHVIPDSTSAPIGRLIDWARGQEPR